MIDYFAPPPSREEAVLRGIKGSYRRVFVGRSIDEDGLDSIPDAWKAHEISENLKGMLQGQHPQARGGEDLPNLEEGEVEIARLTLVNSVHGEVTSLRARPGESPGDTQFRMADEYGEEIDLPRESSNAPLTEDEVIGMFRDAEPSQTATGCEMEFQSFFYPDLDACAERLGVI